MIDPLGPDPTDPATPPRMVGEIVPEFQRPEPPRPPRPKVRYANYDSPEAIRLKSLPESSSPAIEKEHRKLKPTEPPPSASATTALARNIPPPHKPSKLERVLGVAKTVLPLVGNLLPLLEGNVVGAATNFMANRPAQEINLKPLEEAIAKLQAEQRALAFHSGEHKRAIQRLEDELAALQETVQKNATDQAELIEQMAKFAKRTSGFMRLVTILLVISILFTTLLVVRIAYILRF
jgi:hypothetical protein